MKKKLILGVIFFSVISVTFFTKSLSTAFAWNIFEVRKNNNDAFLPISNPFKWRNVQEAINFLYQGAKKVYDTIKSTILPSQESSGKKKFFTSASEVVSTPSIYPIKNLQLGLVSEGEEINQYVISWDHIEGDKSRYYEIQISEDPEFKDKKTITLRSSATLLDLKKDTTYYIRVRAHVGWGIGSWSDVIVVSPDSSFPEVTLPPHVPIDVPAPTNLKLKLISEGENKNLYRLSWDAVKVDQENRGITYRVEVYKDPECRHLKSAIAPLWTTSCELLLDKGKTYYIKVKAHVEIFPDEKGCTRYDSPWSEVLMVP